ncbi:glycosyltransferase [Neobacillus drentensis]|uniref:glycosyltransferase n=1 Tax=Neobacillus drentensis TaxID=220684 RepID=UPI003000D8DD
MKTIAYYISDYGYGHASRSIAIIRELLKIPEVRIIVCHSFALPFIKESLNSDRVKYRSIKTDVGYFLAKDSIYPDKELLIIEYKNFVVDWDNLQLQERNFLQKNNVDLVISDISPLPFEAAESLDIPSIGVSNFTWYTAYDGLIDEGELKVYKEAYQKMSYYFSLAGSQEDWNVNTKEFGFFSREVDDNEVSRIRRLVNPYGNKKIIFLGLGMKIDVGTLERLPIWSSPDCVFLISSNVQVDLPNTFQIPAGYLESQNYIAASDLVISKAGWGMVGEAVSSNIPLLILNRPSMKEDQNTINYLKQKYICETIEWEEFKTFQINLSKIYKMKKATNYLLINQAEEIAANILNILQDSRRSFIKYSI